MVDSASRDAETLAIASRFGTAVREEVPGLSRARNAGVRAARHPIIAFTDDDCRPQESWLARIAGAFDDASVDFVTGAVAAIEGTGGAASTTTDRAARRFRLGDDPAGFGHGANMAFRRTVLVEIGGFDEALGAGSRLRSGEDKDAFQRVLELRREGVYAPDAIVRHVQWRGRRELVGLRYGYGLGNGAVRAGAARRQPRRGVAPLVAGVWNDGLRGVYWGLRRPSLAVVSATSHLGGYVVGAAVVLTRRTPPGRSTTGAGDPPSGPAHA